MTESMERQVTHMMLKWGIGIIGMLIVAGAGSLATRNVYSKDESDAIMTQHKTEVEMELDHLREVQSIQTAHTNEQLGLIRNDIGEVKQMIKERQ